MSEPRVKCRLVFGVDRVPEEIIGGGRKLSDPNPCVVAYGPGPEGARCKTCRHLFAQPGVAGRYLKCDQRLVTGGPATDHLANWPACARYEPGRVP